MEENSKLMPCKVCGKEISRTAKVCPRCGEGYEVSMENRREINKVSKEYANTGTKSRLISFILILLVGPFGLLYTSFSAFIKTIIFVIVFAFFGASLADDPNTKNIAGIFFVLSGFMLYIYPLFKGDSIIVNERKRRMSEAKLMTLR